MLMEHCCACPALWRGGASDNSAFPTGSSNHKGATFWNWRNNHQMDSETRWLTERQTWDKTPLSPGRHRPYSDWGPQGYSESLGISASSESVSSSVWKV